MAPSIHLLKIFLLFCVSLTNAADYSAYAHWITTSDFLENKAFKDLTSNNNGPFQSAISTDGSINEGTITCASFLTPSTSSYYGLVQSLDSASAEYGISVWLNIPKTSSGSVFSIGSGPNGSTATCKLVVSNSGTSVYFQTNYGGSLYQDIARDKWVFIVFYLKNNGSYWTWYYVSPEVSFDSQNFSKGFPGKYIHIGYNVAAYYYEIQTFKSSGFGNNPVVLYDSAGTSYTATTKTCPAACSGSACHPKIGCLSKTDCYCSAICNCSNGDWVCTSCKDITYSAASNCMCKIGFKLDSNNKCVYGNFYTDGPLHCVTGTSKTVCTQCETNYFLYDDGTSTICLDCDSCDTCNASPNCYECVNAVVQDGDTCRVDSIGIQLSFDSPNVVIDFAHPLSKDLKINKFSATTVTNQDISTEGWIISGSSTPKQYQIVTNLSENQLPINLDFAFEQI